MNPTACASAGDYVTYNKPYPPCPWTGINADTKYCNMPDGTVYDPNGGNCLLFSVASTTFAYANGTANPSCTGPSTTCIPLVGIKLNPKPLAVSACQLSIPC
jgi:hypothetical protein